MRGNNLQMRAKRGLLAALGPWHVMGQPLGPADLGHPF